jgi:hyperosmotically inducible protein
MSFYRTIFNNKLQTMKQFNIPSNVNVWIAIFIMLCTASCSGKRSDEKIQQDVKEILMTSGGGSGQSYPNVSAAVKEGTVTLSGQCETENCADSALARVKKIEGVKEVVSNIRQAPAQTDYTLRTSVQSVISKYQGVQADVAAGVVVLRGTIKREQIQPLMNELSSLQPKKIDNQLAIQ